MTNRFRVRYSYADEFEEYVSGLKSLRYRVFFTRYKDLSDLEQALGKKFLGRSVVIWDYSEFPARPQSIWIRWNGEYMKDVKSHRAMRYQTVMAPCESVEAIGVAELVKTHGSQLEEFLDVDGRVSVHIKHRSWSPVRGVWMRLNSFYQHLDHEFRSRLWTSRFDSNMEHEDSQTLTETARFAAENEPDLFRYLSIPEEEVMKGMPDIFRTTGSTNMDEFYGRSLTRVRNMWNVRTMNSIDRRRYILSFYVLLTPRRSIFYAQYRDKIREICEENKIRRVHSQ